jgi:hypothetical protein
MTLVLYLGMHRRWSASTGMPAMCPASQHLLQLQDTVREVRCKLARIPALYQTTGIFCASRKVFKQIGSLIIEPEGYTLLI